MAKHEMDLEGLIQRIAKMERMELVEVLRTIPTRFPIDFTDEFLEGLGLDRLRHVVLAACLQVRKVA